MFQALIDRFKTTKEQPKDGANPLHAAAAALLVEAACLDGTFDDTERTAMGAALSAHFELSADDAAALIEEGVVLQQDANQLYGFTKIIKDALEPEERVAIIEMLWDVAYADGVLHDYEAGLVRRVTGLLFVSDREAGDARKRVLTRRGLT